MSGLLQLIRGPSRSLRHRLVLKPIREISFLLQYRMMGRSRLDYWADLSDSIQATRLDQEINQSHLNRGRYQFEYMISHGLKPTHCLLDYGCGPLLGGLHFARYLLPGNYVAADISRRVMQRGVGQLSAAGIPRKNYHVVLIRDFDVPELIEFRFDYVFSDSALQYASDEHFGRIMQGVRKTLVLGGQFHFTFPGRHKGPELKAKGQFFRSPEAIGEIVSRMGYRFSWTAVESNEWPGPANIGIATAA